MGTEVLPLDAEGLTPAWVTHALSARHPGVRVSAVELLSQRASTNHHVRLGLTFDEQAGAPDTLFCKMASLDAQHRAAIGATGMGAREARFYRDLAPSLSMRNVVQPAGIESGASNAKSFATTVAMRDVGSYAAAGAADAAD